MAIQLELRFEGTCLACNGACVARVKDLRGKTYIIPCDVCKGTGAATPREYAKYRMNMLYGKFIHVTHS